MCNQTCSKACGIAIKGSAEGTAAPRRAASLRCAASAPQGNIRDCICPTERQQVYVFLRCLSEHFLRFTFALRSLIFFLHQISALIFHIKTVVPFLSFFLTEPFAIVDSSFCNATIIAFAIGTERNAYGKMITQLWQNQYDKNK